MTRNVSNIQYRNYNGPIKSVFVCISCMAKISSPSETRKLLPSVYVRQSKRRQGLLSGKWTRVVIFGLALALCTRFFAAWSQYRGLLVRGGKYRWVCNPEDIQVDAYGYESCNEQINRLSELFMISSAAEPLGSIVAGILFDALGPRFASLIGVVSVELHEIKLLT